MQVMRKNFSERNPVLLGVIGTAALVLVLLLSLSYKSLPFFDSGRSYTAIFTESGGLSSGDDVEVAGMSVGTVSSVGLDHARVRVQFKVTDDGVHLGALTQAAITTETVLGKRGLKLTSAGPGTLAEGATIPTSRTIAPYDLTDALSGLTTTESQIDTASMAKALETITNTLHDTPAPLAATVRSVSRISSTIASRDSEISGLLAASDNVSSILARRNVQITTLLSDGTKLLAVINARRRAVASLLVEASRLAQQLRGVVADNRTSLGPALAKLTAVVDLLNRNKTNLDEILDRAGPFAGSLGESVSSGPFFQAYVQNLTRPVDLVGLDTSPLEGIPVPRLPGLPGVGSTPKSGG
jgi:phospholipid/cholesterol/gamma-HCH transport system substrate-binding protein